MNIIFRARSKELLNCGESEEKEEFCQQFNNFIEAVTESNLTVSRNENVDCFHGSGIKVKLHPNKTATRVKRYD